MSAKIQIPKSIENLDKLINRVSKNIYSSEEIQKPYFWQQKFLGQTYTCIKPFNVCTKFKFDDNLRIQNAANLFSNQELTIIKGKNKIGISNSVSVFNHINFSKKLSGLETKLTLAEEEKKKKQKLRNELSHWIDSYESEVSIKELVKNDSEQSYSLSGNLIRRAIDKLAQAVKITLMPKHEPRTIHDLYAERVKMLAATNAEIKENDKTISYIKAVRTFLNNVFKRFEVNIREFIGSINNFNFKNLDDTHSTLISLGY
ncbi:hypothetical protein [Flavobacterium microcysteis]|uniref:Uncharacterized protein n=1 Tax=Flavobacterium microcysteis TaxID=2596891 RepID=A0A501Q997_9FLAO|nr:hypothetical protein [Flavobacterium microcysteis]TPD68541.1 hypothetical protein FJA49_10790 [Flavobacterium microcysteis]